MQDSRPQILIADDQSSLRKLFGFCLRKATEWWTLSVTAGPY